MFSHSFLNSAKFANPSAMACFFCHVAKFLFVSFIDLYVVFCFLGVVLLDWLYAVYSIVYFAYSSGLCFSACSDFGQLSI